MNGKQWGEKMWGREDFFRKAVAFEGIGRRDVRGRTERLNETEEMRMERKGREPGRKGVRVELSKGGWRKLGNVNRERGAGFIRAYKLREELSEYLERHEGAGITLDTECQELRYEEGTCVLIRKVQGVWYITDIWTTQLAVGFIPLFVWQKVRRGCREAAARILAGWQAVRTPRDEGELALQ